MSLVAYLIARQHNDSHCLQNIEHKEQLNQFELTESKASIHVYKSIGLTIHLQTYWSNH